MPRPNGIDALLRRWLGNGSGKPLFKAKRRDGGLSVDDRQQELRLVESVIIRPDTETRIEIAAFLTDGNYALRVEALVSEQFSPLCDIHPRHEVRGGRVTVATCRTGPVWMG